MILLCEHTHGLPHTHTHTAQCETESSPPSLGVLARSERSVYSLDLVGTLGPAERKNNQPAREAATHKKTLPTSPHTRTKTGMHVKLKISRHAFLGSPPHLHPPSCVSLSPTRICKEGESSERKAALIPPDSCQSERLTAHG